MKIVVTEKHIKKGYSMSNTMCPVALAIKEVVKGKRISVGKGWEDGERLAWVHIGDTTYMLPWSAAIFIHRYDAVKLGTPFEFELEYENGR